MFHKVLIHLIMSIRLLGTGMALGSESFSHRFLENGSGFCGPPLSWLSGLERSQASPWCQGDIQ
jgi:hypothetical protein